MKVFCSKCLKTIPSNGPRVILHGAYVCGTCLYEMEHGRASLDRQLRLANLRDGRCICVPQRLKGRWEGADKQTLRTIHATDCPKHKSWMSQEAIA